MPSLFGTHVYRYLGPMSLLCWGHVTVILGHPTAILRLCHRCIVHVAVMPYHNCPISQHGVSETLDSSINLDTLREGEKDTLNMNVVGKHTMLRESRAKGMRTGKIEHEG